MINFIKISNAIDKDKYNYGTFLFEPLEIGQGITLGNKLRRTLMSDLYGYGITGVRFNNIKHEFSTIEGLREDLLEVILNLKNIRFKSLNSKNIKPITGFLKVEGANIVTSNLFNFPKNTIKVINPSEYLCTYVGKSELYMEIDVQYGKGYQLSEDQKDRIKKLNFNFAKPNTILLDTIFTPIKNVNYKVKLIHDELGNIKESLFLEIITNGSVTPTRCLNESLKLLLNVLSSIFFNFRFFQISKKLEN